MFMKTIISLITLVIIAFGLNAQESKFDNDLISTQKKTLVNNKSIKLKSNPVKPLLVSDDSSAIPGVYKGETKCADYDNDGDFDVLITGNINDSVKITALYINNNGSFTPLDYDFKAVNWSSADWGDYNGDGFVDVVVTGLDTSGTRSTIIYKNNQQGSFVTLDTLGIADVYEGAGRWADYDNDGDLDLVVSGSVSGSRSITRVYRNDGNDIFTTGQSLQGLDEGFLSLHDFDNDGDIDIVVSGKENNDYNYIGTFVYRNNNGSFAKVTDTEYTWDGSIDWQDYDDDGDLDGIHTGWDGYGSGIIFVLKNNGDLSFGKVNYSTLVGFDYGDARWGDFNYDGISDLFTSGRYIKYTGSWNVEPTSAMYTFDTLNDVFTNQYWPVDSLTYSSVQWVDFENDSTVEIIYSGLNDSAQTVILSDLWPLKNNPPEKITETFQEIKTDTVILSWNSTTDFDNVEQSLSYNFYVYSLTEEKYLVAPMADTSTGIRTISGLGNASLDTTWTIKNLNPGVYIWGVQALDKVYQGGKFSGSKTFKILPTAEDLSYNIKDSLLIGTTSDLEYNINDQVWISCSNDTTYGVSYEPGVIVVRDKESETIILSDTLTRPVTPLVSVDYFYEYIGAPGNGYEYSYDSMFAEYLIFDTNNIVVHPLDSIYFRIPPTKDSLCSEIFKLYLPQRPPTPNVTFDIETSTLEWDYVDNITNPEEYTYLLYDNDSAEYWEPIFENPFYVYLLPNNEENFGNGYLVFFVSPNSIKKRFRSEKVIFNLYDEYNKPSGKNLINEDQIQIFPNPVTDKLYINSSENIDKVRIYDLQGKLVFEQNTGSTNIQLDLTELDSGIYNIKIYRQGVTQNTKLIIK